MKNILYLSIFALMFLPQMVGAASLPHSEVFNTTAYYSAEQNQSYYYQGSYENEILMNGHGYATASGRAPYDGVVAAPKTFEFGTVVYLHSRGGEAARGWAMVEDRGGAIVSKNERSDNLNRIDIWTGKGETGVNTALNWGRNNIEVTVFSKELGQVGIYNFDTNLDLEDEGEKVRQVQEYLKALGFLNHSATGYYGPVTQKAVLDFQIWKGIVTDANMQGAGRVGPGTRLRLNGFSNAMNDLQEKRRVAQELNPPHQRSIDIINEFYSTPLSEGDTNYQVAMLQRRLERLGYFDHPYITYDFKSKTKQALLNYQIDRGIVASSTDQGAGVFGPSTSQKLRSELISIGY